MTNDTCTALLARAAALRVSSLPTRQDAADLWDLLRTARKNAEAQKETTCRPLKTAWEEAKRPYDDFARECQTYEARLQAAMADWDREQDRLSQIEQARIQAKVDAQNEKIAARAQAKGIELVMKIAPVVPVQPKSLETASGAVQTRSERTVYGITGMSMTDPIRADHPAVAGLLAHFPALFTLDMVAFRKLASTGMLDAVPGIERRIEYVYTQRTR